MVIVSLFGGRFLDAWAFWQKISPDLLLFSPTSNGVPQLQKSAGKKKNMPTSYHKPLSNGVSLWTREHANNNPQLSIFAVVFTPSKSMPSCTSKVQCIQWGHSVPGRKPTSFFQHHFESSCESEPLTAIVVFQMFFTMKAESGNGNQFCPFFFLNMFLSYVQFTTMWISGSK